MKNKKELTIKELENKANEFIKKCNVISVVHATEGGFIELDSLLVDFVKYIKT